MVRLAYDSDDVVFRLLTFTIMTGSLMLAAGVPTSSTTASPAWWWRGT